MPDETVFPQLILASASPYRAELLGRLGLPFEIVTAGVDESPLDHEAPDQLVMRLAQAKAAAVAASHPDAVVIGSDQVAVHHGRILGKPGNKELAIQQLARFSGSVVQFLTSVMVLQPGGRAAGNSVVETRVEFRQLGEEEIHRYIESDRPLDCAGSFKAESLGPALFRSMFSQDPTAIIGLPLIETCRLLRIAGFQVP